MKTLNKCMMILGLLFFALQGCTHEDYTPVPGPAGENGVDGIAGTASCTTCHSAAYKEPIINAYNQSVHNLGILNTTTGLYSKHVYGTNTTFADGSLNSNRAFCSECHSQEGYIDVKKYGKPNPRGYDNVKSINCEGCHGTTHRSLNFAVDGNDFGLRNIAAVIQKTNPAFTLNASPTGGTSSSNTCIGCHQARPDSNGYYKRPVFEMNEKDASGNPVITGSGSTQFYRFWSQRKLADAVAPYPAGTTFYKIYSNSGTQTHVSEQGDLWMGINGIDIEGTTTRLPAAKTGKHYTSASCVQCHMDKPKPGTTNTGSHTMKLSYQTCVTCHSAPEALLATFHAKFDTELTKLKSALTAQSTYFATSTVAVGNTPAGTISIKTFDSVTGLPFPTSPGSGNTTAGVWYQSRTDFPLKYVQAYWNYKLVSGDEGRGVHNPLYSMALIQNSIEALK